MSDSSFTMDTREWDQAMVEYAAASGKDFAWISNKRTQQSCIHAIKLAAKANVGQISALFGQDNLIWWLARKFQRDQSAGGMYDNKTKAINAIRRRIKSVSFIKSFFSIMSSLLAPYTGKRSSKAKPGSRKGFSPWVKPATAQQPTAEVGIKFSSRNYTSVDKAKVEKLLVSALQKGINADTRDMMIYVDRKTGETAGKYSAK